MDIIKNRIYKHFKGDYYLVLDTAINTDNNEKYVIYRALYNNGQLYVRPYNEFTSKVDHNKYPTATQEYRFELQDITSIKEKNHD